MKYVILECRISRALKVALFDDDIVHAKIAHAARVSMRSLFVVSAGFWCPHAKKVRGRSDSLNIDSRVEDSEIINSRLG